MQTSHPTQLAMDNETGMMPTLRQVPVEVQAGCVDFIAYSAALNGWLAGGWIGHAWDDQDRPSTGTLNFGHSTIRADAIVCLFSRSDVRKIGNGIVLFIPGSSDRTQDLHELIIERDGVCFSLAPSKPLERLTEAEAFARVEGLIKSAGRSERRACLLRLVNRPSFNGQDTLDKLQSPVFLEIDAGYLCPPDGLLLRGWFVDPFRHVASIRVRCGSQSAPLDPAKWIAIPRPDVRDSITAQFGGTIDRCGFLAFVPSIHVAGEAMYFEVQTVAGEIAFKRIPALRSPGIGTIKDTLSHLDLRYDELVHGFDNVLGPAVEAMNSFRLGAGVGYKEMQFGPLIDAPRCSIVVPLFGRMDFMEFQLAFFSRTLAADHELIYVLDDPPRLRAAEALAASVLARFKRPFRLIALDTNVGYAPANNVGLKFARGEYVCFLNSDVFPKADDWLEHMLETAARPEVGAVGALLLFEDGTLQHDGCSYEVLPEFGGWTFSLHPRKGRFPPDGDTVHEVEAITGACFVMRTDVARGVGGLDEGYVIGDFEDVDLCRKVQSTGRVCMVDRRAQLFHLERQSQGSGQNPWRMNLTLYNAWRFQRRWVKSDQAAALKLIGGAAA